MNRGVMPMPLTDIVRIGNTDAEQPPFGIIDAGGGAEMIDTR